MKTSITKKDSKTSVTATDGLSLKEKISYSFTDMAGNLLYVTISSYILYFYTDVFKISVAGAGAILLIARVFDAVSAPIWGSIVDRTNTKWGQSRPYFLWLAIPFAVASFLAFTAPDLSENMKLIYAGVTYILAAGIIYTGIQTPITSILPNLTSNPNERISANSFRMIGGQLGSFITCTFCLPLVSLLGKGNDKKGFMLTLAIFGVLATVLLLTAFKNLREKPRKNTKPLSFKESLKATKGNKPWFILVVAFVIFWIAQADRNSISIYYAKYNLGNEQLVSVFNGLQVLGIGATLMIPLIVRKTNKTLTMIIGLIIGAFGQAMMYFAGDKFGLVIAAWVIGIIGAAIAVAMPFAMLADTVDFGEWKSGVRAAGFLTAVGSAFCIQLGSGLGSFIPTKIMASAGYVANATQSTSALSAIEFCFIWLPIIIYVLSGLVMLFYFKYEKMEPQIKKELFERQY
ncbi:MAG: MFS transporter [Enterococcus sp.]